MSIGDKIKNIRCAKMMTQQELAGEFITRNMLSRIENGFALPSIPTLVYLAEKLGVPAGYLLADESEEFQYRKNAGILREIGRSAGICVIISATAMERSNISFVCVCITRRKKNLPKGICALPRHYSTDSKRKLQTQFTRSII